MLFVIKVRSRRVALASAILAITLLSILAFSQPNAQAKTCVYHPDPSHTYIECMDELGNWVVVYETYLV